MKLTVSQLVFLLITVAVVIAFLWGVFTNTTSLEDSKAFIGLVGMVFGYYFGSPTPKQDEVATGVAK